VVYYLLICRSLTYAQRSAKALEHAGITAIVTRVPAMLSSSGCGYGVKLSAKHISNALVVLANANLHPLKIFVQYADGNFNEVNI